MNIQHYLFHKTSNQQQLDICLTQPQDKDQYQYLDILLNKEFNRSRMFRFIFYNALIILREILGLALMVDNLTYIGSCGYFNNISIYF